MLAAGGTFDKIYYDAKSDYRVGPPQAQWITEHANLGIAIDVKSVIRKDSLDMTADDRETLKIRAAESNSDRIIITHGTDTMVETAKHLRSLDGKTIVLVGAMQPACFRDSDAVFNLGFAVAAVQLLPPGTYIAMNGKILDPESAYKNRDASRFERLSSDTT